MHQGPEVGLEVVTLLGAVVLVQGFNSPGSGVALVDLELPLGAGREEVGCRRGLAT